MAKGFYLPRTDAEKMTWLNNFALKFVVHQPTIGLPPADATATTNDAAYWEWFVETHMQEMAKAQEWTASKNILRDDANAASPHTSPTPLTLAPEPGAVPPGIFTRIRALVRRIKAAPAYTVPMGEDLGIEGAEQTIDLPSMKPDLSARITSGGHPELVWLRRGMDALEIEVDRGAGWVLLAMHTEPNYVDHAALPPSGQSAVWHYRAIYRLNDEQVGQWSDVATIAVMG